jgi:hypothetical protein
MTPEHEMAVIGKMKEFGGSFVKALAKSYEYADPVNRAKIRETWPEYWKNYEILVLQDNVYPLSGGRDGGWPVV